MELCYKNFCMLGLINCYQDELKSKSEFVDNIIFHYNNLILILFQKNFLIRIEVCYLKFSINFGSVTLINIKLFLGHSHENGPIRYSNPGPV